MMLTSNEFSAIRRIHLENSNELGIRRYDAFLYDGFLTHYKPEFAANPLRNMKTARVFAHYIHVVRKPRSLKGALLYPAIPPSTLSLVQAYM